VLARNGQGVDHVGDSRALCNQRRAPVDHAVPYGTCLLVPIVSRSNHPPAQPGSQLLHCGRINTCRRLDLDHAAPPFSDLTSA
jgi:hypothetical protein